jgi:hypothetical protein
MAYKRSSRIARHFVSRKFRPLLTNSDFFNSNSRFHFYEKVIKVKADVAALHIFFLRHRRCCVRGVESCQGRRLLAFILTLDSSPPPFKNRAGDEAQRSSVELRPYLMGLAFVSCPEGMQARSHPPVLGFGIAVHRTYIDSRLSNLPRNPGRRHPHLPCFYPHSKWATSGPRCMLGFALKPRSITTVTDLGC